MTKPMKRVFVCSPLRAGNGFTFEQNVAFAKKLCHEAVKAGYAAWAPHIFYTLFLDDEKERERALGIQAGLAWLTMSDEMWLYADDQETCSEGMRKEVEFALKLSIPPTLLYMPKPWQGLTR